MRPWETVVEIPIAEIQPNRYQPRQSMGDAALHELAESIREHGVLQPIWVRRAESGYELVAGERRLRAAQLAGLTRVPACVRDYSDEQALELALVENVQREDISALEAARAYQRLSEEFGLTQEQIAAKVGKSRSTVANTIRLLQLSPREQRRLEAGEITEGHARALLASPPDQRERMLDEILQGGTSVREAEQMARSGRGTEAAVSERTAKAGAADANLAAVEARLRERFGTRVLIQRRGAKGAISLEFYSEEDLERLVRLMGVGA